MSYLDKITEILGDEASGLLEHKSEKITKERLNYSRSQCSRKLSGK